MKLRLVKRLFLGFVLHLGTVSVLTTSHVGMATAYGQAAVGDDGPYRLYIPFVSEEGTGSDDAAGFSEIGTQKNAASLPAGIVSNGERSLPDIRQPEALHPEAFVEIEIIWTDEAVAAALADMDLYCEAVDPCVLTVGEGMLSRLTDAGVEFSEQARGVKYSLGLATAEAVQYRLGVNTTIYPIPDLSGTSGFAFSPISISDAPAGQTVTRVRYAARVVHSWPGDLWIQLDNAQGTGVVLWAKNGGATDGGFDDDIEDDDDVYFYNRWINDAFDGDDVNQNWYLDVWDDAAGHVGYIDYFVIWVYYETPPDIDVQPGTTTFTDTVAVDSPSSSVHQETAAPSPPERLERNATNSLPPARAELPIAVPGELLVGYEPGVGAAALGAASVSSDLDIARSVESISVALVTVPLGEEESYIAELEANPAVRYAEPNYYYYTTLVPNDTDYGSMWGLPKINAPAAWDVTTGSSDVVIAVIDSGVDYTHPDLAGKVVSGYDFVNDDADPMDDNGHGTHVAGTAAAATNNNLGVAGVSWHSKIMPLKVASAAGSISSADAIPAIVYAADNGADVINMSLGGEYPSQAYQDAVNYAYNAGLVVIAASGNCGDPLSYSCWTHNAIAYPAAYDHVISVAATAQDDSRASFSNYNFAVDVAAPGVDILSTIPGTTYDERSGTSMASPHVAGLAALILAANPDASNYDVEAILKQTATDLGAPGRDDEFGYGLINAEAAVLSSHMKALVIDNLGTQPLQITSIEEVNGSCWLSVDVPVTLPYELAGLQSLIVPLSADASCVTDGLYSEILRISSNDGDEPVVDVDVFLDVDSIVVPIAGLSAGNDGPTQLGNATQFSASVSAGSSPTYSWDFGDGSSGSGPNPSHTYQDIGTYTAEVTVSNGLGSDSTTTVVQVVDVPVSGLSAGNDGPTELGDATTFNASVSGGTNVSYTWDFGDGSSGSGSNPSHTYGQPGTYTAKVTASNAVNETNQTTTIQVLNDKTDISGTVYIDANENGEQDAQEPGVANVDVTLMQTEEVDAQAGGAAGIYRQSADPVATTSTDDDGVYLLEDVLAGEYTITLEFPAGSGIPDDVVVPLVIEEDADGQLAIETQFNIAVSAPGPPVFLPLISQ